jgi:AmmeMemoRadiSam system protein A
MLPLSEADQQTLLRMAREALVGYLNFAEIPKVPEPGETLRQPCGAFVTLRKGKNLRGCIGVIEAKQPLYITVRQCAVWAGLHDPRFRPVMKQEVRGLNLQISVLSPLFDIAPENIEVGRHGLLISIPHGAQRGLLLPQVAVEQKWGRQKFLEETCHKAGLPIDAWQQGATIQAFTAQVFEELHPTSSSPPAA